MNITTKQKILAPLALCFASAGLLAGCGGNSQDNSSSSNTQLLAASVPAEACQAEWDKKTTYHKGDKVSYRDINYTAAMDTTGDRPSSNSNNGPAGSGKPWITGASCGGTATTTTTTATTVTTAPATSTTVTTAQSTTTTVISTTTTTASSGPVIKVSDAKTLAAAIASAKPGNIIEMADGSYANTKITGINGSSGKPITLRGSKKAVLSSSTGLQMTDSNYWVLDGFTVTNCGNKGIVLDTSGNNVLQNLEVSHIGLEAVHFRTHSANNVIQNSSVHDTGESDASYGEGVYLGSANSNWKTYTNGKPDLSNNNRVLNNHIGPNVAAEGVDVKEGTSGGLIEGNAFDGTGLQGQNSGDSLIDVKGSGYTIKNNTVTGSGKFYLNGFEAHDALKDGVSGSGNTFYGNSFSGLPASGYGILVAAAVGKNTYCTNNKITTGAGVLGFGVGGIPYSLTVCN